LTKNLLSISALDKKGFRVAFIDGEVLMWPKGKTIEDAIVIGTKEGGLYKLKGHSEAAMTYSTESPEARSKPSQDMRFSMLILW
jgi:hypothetical protein